MLKKIGRKILSSLLILITLLLGIGSAPQTEIGEQSKTITFEELGFLEDDTFKGINAVREYGILLPVIWEPEDDSKITLWFSHAKALTNQSSFAIEFNGIRLSSIELTSINDDHGKITVEIPKETWEEGYNRLRLVFYLGFEDFDCLNLDDELLWFTIHNTSNYQLKYRLKELSPELNAFPAPFIAQTGIIENNITIILPDIPTSAEVNAASLISATLGQLASWRTLNLTFASQSDALKEPEKIEGNVSLIVRIESLPLLKELNAPWKENTKDKGSLLGENGDPYPQNTSILWAGQFFDNPYQALLVVTGDTDQSVLQAARALSQGSIVEQLPGSLALINQVPDSVSTHEDFTSTFTLEKYHYQDITTWGTSEQQTSYSLPFATSWKVIDDATLRLHFSHSSFGEFDESFITVLVNGTPAGTIPLTEENTEDAWKEIIIPWRLFAFGENLITITSNINLPDEYRDARYDCLDDDPTAAWLVVFADSEMTVPLGPSTDMLTLNNFPYAFIGSSDLSDFGIIIPEKSNKLLTEMVIRLSENLGHYINGEGIDLRVYTPQELATAEERPAYLMLIGRPTDNSEIAELNDKMPQPFKEGTNIPVALNNIVQVNPSNGDIGYLQSLNNEDGKPVLIATGTSNQGIVWAIDALMDSASIENLFGDLALTRAKGSISSALVQDKEELIPVVEEVAIEPVLEKNNLSLWIGIGFAFVTFVLVSIKIIEETIKTRKLRKKDE